MVQPEARQHVVQDHAVQVVDARPGQLARHHPRHGRSVAVAPRGGERIAIHLRMQRGHLARDAAVPVDDGAEDIECEDVDIAGGKTAGAGSGGHGASLGRSTSHPCMKHISPH
ncbi:hypothetical protein D9M68_947650 [compost metagenome]